MAWLAAAVTLSCAIPGLAAKISVPQNIRWEDSKACWDEAEDAFQYQVQLYRNGSKLDYTINTNGLSIDLSGYMRKKGRYTFRVKVRDRISDEYGRYSELSTSYVQEKDLDTNKTNTRRTTKKTNTTKVNTQNGDENPGPGVVGKNWQHDGSGWWYRNEDGSYPAGEWKEIDQAWYYFREDGYRHTGWLTIEGARYYCHEDGTRAIGWVEIDEEYFYFDENGVYRQN